MEVSSQIHAPAALSPGETEPQVLIQKEVGRLVEEKHLFSLLGFEPRVVQPAVQSLFLLRRL
jgi:hypothetical protein